MKKGTAPTLKRERALWERGHVIVAGIDEVGRGSWAGPVVAAAVVPPKEGRLYRIRDSKLLTHRQRELLVPKIIDWADAVGVGSASEGEVDSLGLSEAVRLAGTRSLENLNIEVDHVILDGNWNYLLGSYSSEAIVAADRICLSVAAASIVAKVTRDRLLGIYDQVYPDYGFASHKGYASSFHVQALEQMGICEIHRRRFLPIRKLVPDELFFTHIETGRIGETYGAEYLEQEGYEILDRNYRTRFGEIDIIARDSGDLVFVEVKTRTSEQYGLPEEAVDKRKQQKLIRMALTYVADEGYDGDYRIDVLAIEVENNRPKRVELFKHAVNQV